jgi:RNA polymerase sigma factor (sigma-70 family)
MSLTESAGFEPSAEETVIRRDSAATLRAAVARLPSPQREALVLRFTTRLPVREIGAVIGKGEDSTEKLIARAIKRLREDFDDHQL